MANSAQARKRARQSQKNRAQAEFVAATKVMDRIADKGVFHKNKAARHKSRLAAKIKAMA